MQSAIKNDQEVKFVANTYEILFVKKKNSSDGRELGKQLYDVWKNRKGRGYPFTVIIDPKTGKYSEAISGYRRQTWINKFK